MNILKLLSALLVISACSSKPDVFDRCAFYDTTTPDWIVNQVYEHGYGMSKADSEDSAKTALAKRIVTDVSYRLDARDGEIVRKNMSITSDVRFTNLTLQTVENKASPGCWITWASVSPKEADLILARRWARDAYESLDWIKVKRSDNTEDVVAFLSKYPGGIHQRDAEEKLAEMKRRENKELVRVSLWFGILAAMSVL